MMVRETREVNTMKAMTNVDHIEPERWVFSWLMLTSLPSARRCTNASKIGKKCVTPTKK